MSLRRNNKTGDEINMKKRLYCAWGVDKSFKWKWQAAIASYLFKVKVVIKKVMCKHDYYVKNVYIGATGEKSELHECRACNKKKWVSL